MATFPKDELITAKDLTHLTKNAGSLLKSATSATVNGEKTCGSKPSSDDKKRLKLTTIAALKMAGRLLCHLTEPTFNIMLLPTLTLPLMLGRFRPLCFVSMSHVVHATILDLGWHFSSCLFQRHSSVALFRDGGWVIEKQKHAWSGHVFVPRMPLVFNGQFRIGKLNLPNEAVCKWLILAMISLRFSYVCYIPDTQVKRAEGNCVGSVAAYAQDGSGSWLIRLYPDSWR